MPSCPLDSHVDKSYQRNSMASRDTMMRNLLKITDNGRDQGTKEHYIDRQKLTLIDELTHAPHAESNSPLCFVKLCERL